MTIRAKSVSLLLVVTALLAAACNAAVSLTSVNCPITEAPNPPFVPPNPSPKQPPNENHFWYGSDALFTMVPESGQWDQLAWGEKVFWWSEDYNFDQEPVPALTVTARRLDSPAPKYVTTDATNASHASFGRTAMLVGVMVAEPGCWEISGTYRGETLSFVVWVEP